MAFEDLPLSSRRPGSAFELPSENRQDQNRQIILETLDAVSQPNTKRRQANIDVNLANIDPQAWLAQQLTELDMDQAQFDEVKYHLFRDVQPFAPRPKNMIDKMIAKILHLTKSQKVPIRYIDQ